MNSDSNAGPSSEANAGDSAEDNTAPSDELVRKLYATLRELADRALVNRSSAAGLDPTDVIHEAYIKLSRALDLAEVDRPGFISFAATVIRSVLADAARRGQTLKRGGDRRRITLDESILADRTVRPDSEERSLEGSIAGQEVDILDLDEALRSLANLDERQAHIVELRFFGGLSNGEVGDLLGLSAREVSDEWTVARAYLRRVLRAPGEETPGQES